MRIAGIGGQRVVDSGNEAAVGTRNGVERRECGGDVAHQQRDRRRSRNCRIPIRGELGRPEGGGRWGRHPVELYGRDALGCAAVTRTVGVQQLPETEGRNEQRGSDRKYEFRALPETLPISDDRVGAARRRCDAFHRPREELGRRLG